MLAAAAADTLGKHHPNHYRVKIHHSYTVEEAARALGCHRNTVRHWIKEGLPTTDDKRPLLILGRELRAFLQRRRSKNKVRCRPSELYCVKCRAPRVPAGAMADFEPKTETLGNLVGICPECDTIMNRRVSIAKLAPVCGDLEIQFPQELRHLFEMAQPSLNSDFERGGDNTCQDTILATKE